jgi:hypothetical protein
MGFNSAFKGLNMPEGGRPEYSEQFLYSHMTKNMSFKWNLNYNHEIRKVDHSFYEFLFIVFLWRY